MHSVQTLVKFNAYMNALNDRHIPILSFYPGLNIVSHMLMKSGPAGHMS